MNQPPDAIWLQFYGDGERVSPEDYDHVDGEVSWCADQIFENDVRYIIDKRYKPKKRRPRK